MCLVDLTAELPSFCLRPHMQRAGFLATYEAALYDRERTLLLDLDMADLNSLLIARIRLKFGSAEWEFLEGERRFMFPPAPPLGHCRLCGDEAANDNNHDLMLHKLWCLQNLEPLVDLGVEYPSMLYFAGSNS